METTYKNTHLHRKKEQVLTAPTIECNKGSMSAPISLLTLASPARSPGHIVHSSGKHFLIAALLRARLVNDSTLIGCFALVSTSEAGYAWRVLCALKRLTGCAAGRSDTIESGIQPPTTS
jgi:hypothetical protein